MGSVVTRQLVEAGEKVRILVLPEEKNIPENEKIEVYRGDVTDKESIRSFFVIDTPEESDKVDLYVIHCAGIVSISTGFDQILHDVNVGGTNNILELCVEYKVKKLVYVSSVHAIPEKPHGEVIRETEVFDPELVVGAYAKTKAEATANVLKYYRDKGLDVTVVHPSGISGPYDRGKGHLTALVVDYCKRRLTSGAHGGYDFVDVRDVARGIILACEKGRKGECYILSNQYFSIEYILTRLHEMTGQKRITRFLPLWFLKITAGIAEIYYKIIKTPPLFTTYSIYTLNSNSNFSHEKADKELGYTTGDFETTLKDTVEWLKKEGRI